METKKPITQKQENFCLAYVECGNASEAYRRAYNAENMKSESINVNASKLLADANLALRVSELRALAAQTTAITVADLIKELEEARQAALGAETPQAAAATGATMGNAKLLGLDKQIIEQTVTSTVDQKVTHTVTNEAMDLLAAKLSSS